MIKQYVNLPNNAADHYGASVNLVVDADQLADASTAYTEWWIEATGGENIEAKYLGATSRARMRYRTRHHAGTRFRNTLLLPHVGGDKYKVKCSKRGDRSSPVEMEEIETWRKVFYSVHWMNADCQRIFNSVKDRFKAAFEEGFVELEQVGFTQTLVDEPKTLSTNVLPHLYNRRPRLTHRPWHLRIVVLNDIYSITEVEHTFAGMDSETSEWTFNGPLADRTPNDWLISARARLDSGGPWIDIRSCMSSADETRFSYDISGNRALSDAVAAGETFTIELGLRLRSHYLGHSIGNFVCTRINESGSAADVEKTILQTFTHEVGHGLQQVVQRERTYNPSGNFTAWEVNGKWHYDDYGGRGPHCHFAATEVDAAVRADGTSTTTSGRTYESSGSTLCTMFFRDDPSVDADGKFCESCRPRLKRANLGRAMMITQHWADY